MLFALFIGIGLVSGFFAGLIAFLITWHEWQKHKFRGRRLFMEAFRAAVFTFIVFLAVSLFASYVLTHWIVNVNP